MTRSRPARFSPRSRPSWARQAWARSAKFSMPGRRTLPAAVSRRRGAWPRCCAHGARSGSSLIPIPMPLTDTSPGIRRARRPRATLRVERGAPSPLGATWDGRGVNFSVFSSVATSVKLCLFGPAGETRLDLAEQTDGCWHGYVAGLQPGQQVRLPRAWSVGAGVGPALQSAQAPARPVRARNLGRGAPRVERPALHARLRGQVDEPTLTMPTACRDRS